MIKCLVGLFVFGRSADKVKCYGENRGVSGLLAFSVWRGEVAVNAKLGAVSETAINRCQEEGWRVEGSGDGSGGPRCLVRFSPALFLFCGFSGAR